jgi:hypothetical protein
VSYPPCPQCAGAPENWLPILDYGGSYEVSDHGRLRSVDRIVTHLTGQRQLILGQMLAPGYDGAGYPQVLLSKFGRGRTTKVHRLVAVTFVGPCPPGEQVRHWDDVKNHNHRGNLLYGTPAENAADAFRNGRIGMLNRTTCPRDHRLVAPNLVVSRLPTRVCLACQRAWVAISIARRQGKPIPDLCILADQRYAKIMGGVAA